MLGASGLRLEARWDSAGNTTKCLTGTLILGPDNMKIWRKMPLVLGLT